MSALSENPISVLSGGYHFTKMTDLIAKNLGLGAVRSLREMAVDALEQLRKLCNRLELFIGRVDSITEPLVCETSEKNPMVDNLWLECDVLEEFPA